jgi:predicted helicase
MDDEVLFGPVLYRLSFGEAIRQGLLADYRVVVCVVDDRERLALTRRRGLVHIGDGRTEAADDLAAKVVLARAMRTWNLRRVLTFHGRVARAGAFAQRFPGVVRWMPTGDAPKGEVWARHVHGKMAYSKRDALLSS